MYTNLHSNCSAAATPGALGAVLLATGLRGRVEGEEVDAVVVEEVRVDWVKDGNGVVGRVVGRVAAAESGGVAMASACRMISSMISGAL